MAVKLGVEGEVASLACSVRGYGGPGNTSVNERVNSLVQAGEPQSGLVAINSSDRDGRRANCGAWGTREENAGMLLHDNASAAVFNAPKTCTHEKWN